jgi:hypothetical protein
MSTRTPSPNLAPKASSVSSPSSAECSLDLFSFTARSGCRPKGQNPSASPARRATARRPGATPRELGPPQADQPCKGDTPRPVNLSPHPEPSRSVLECGSPLPLSPPNLATPSTHPSPSFIPRPPKRQRAGALQDLSASSPTGSAKSKETMGAAALRSPQLPAGVSGR